MPNPQAWNSRRFLTGPSTDMFLARVQPAKPVLSVLLRIHPPACRPLISSPCRSICGPIPLPELHTNASMAANGSADGLWPGGATRRETPLARPPRRMSRVLRGADQALKRSQARTKDRNTDLGGLSDGIRNDNQEVRHWMTRNYCNGSREASWVGADGSRNSPVEPAAPCVKGA